MNKINSVFYMYSNMDRSSQILLFLIILVALMLVSIFIINFITNKKNRKYNEQFNSITRYSNVVKKEQEEKMETKEKQEEIEVIEVINEKNSIEEISKLIENSSIDDPINLTKFEEEQEKDAIISYDELVKKAGAKKIIYKVEEEQEKIEIIPMPKSEEKKKFKASQIVSPIYGIQKENKNQEDIETFIDLEEFNDEMNESDEMKKDIEFLGSLKTFRSELD